VQASGIAGAVFLPALGVGVAGVQSTTPLNQHFKQVKLHGMNVIVLTVTRGAMNTPEAMREAAAGKCWDNETRQWVDEVSNAVAIDDPVYADARARYQTAKAESNGKMFPYFYDILGVSVRISRSLVYQQCTLHNAIGTSGNMNEWSACRLQLQKLK
jgi:hypothetical protein